MEAVVLCGPRLVKVLRVPMPVLTESDDVIVQVKYAGLCGSDLHPYRGDEKGCDYGITIMGHEFVGHVVRKGTSVTGLEIGDLVCSPFTTCCGSCHYCTHGLPCRCVRGNLFGWVANGIGLQGGQAEFIRVPLASSTLVKVPVGVHPETALLAGDIWSTALFCALNAGIGDEKKPERPSHEVYVVVGLGPVGLLTVTAVILLLKRRGVIVGGTERHDTSHHATVFAVDSVKVRLDKASTLGAIAVDPTTVDVPAIVKKASSGLGALAALEAVGASSALKLAYDCLGHGGTLSTVGVHTAGQFPFPPGALYDKNVTYKSGRCPARRIMTELALPMLSDCTGVFDIRELVVSHRVPLSDAPDAYEMFEKKREGCTKVVFVCGPELAKL